jgi:hypothetical protein
VNVETDLALWFSGMRALAIIAAFIALAWALRRQRRKFAGQLDRILAEQQQARAEAHALAEKVSALATLLAAIPARIERPAAEPPPPPLRTRREVAPMRSYETARRLARSGAPVEEIVAKAGLAASEARLLQSLHGGRDHAA